MRVRKERYGEIWEDNERGSEKTGRSVERSGRVREREREGRGWTAALCPHGAVRPTVFTGL